MSEHNSWHLRKEITIGNILASAVAVIGMFSAFYSLDARIEQNTLQITHNKEAIILERGERKDDFGYIRGQLGDIQNVLREMSK